MKIVRVDKNEFETEDGQIFEHPIPFEETPSLEDFQKIYDTFFSCIETLLND